DRLRDLTDGRLAETRRPEQLLGAMLRARENRRGLRPRPLERLLDLRAGRVRQLRRLVSGLLEEPRALRLGLPELGPRLGVRPRDDLVRLLLRRAEDLGSLPFGVLPVPIDVGLLGLELALPLPNLLLSPAELRRGSV